MFLICFHVTMKGRDHKLFSTDRQSWHTSWPLTFNTAYYTEWGKSEREREILYTNAYIWNLERWLRLIHLQGSNGETDTENRLTDTGGGEEGEAEMYGGVTGTLPLPYVNREPAGNCWMAQETQTGALHQPRGIGWGGRWEGGSRGRRHVYLWLIHVDVW